MKCGLRHALKGLTAERVIGFCGAAFAVSLGVLTLLGLYAQDTWYGRVIAYVALSALAGALAAAGYAMERDRRHRN